MGRVDKKMIVCPRCKLEYEYPAYIIDVVQFKNNAPCNVATPVCPNCKMRTYYYKRSEKEE